MTLAGLKPATHTLGTGWTMLPRYIIFSYNQLVASLVGRLLMAKTIHLWGKVAATNLVAVFLALAKKG